MLMKFIPLSRATTAANSVFPVPGAPYSKTPDACRMGRFANNSGYWKRISTRHILKSVIILQCTVTSLTSVNFWSKQREREGDKSFPVAEDS